MTAIMIKNEENSLKEMIAIPYKVLEGLLEKKTSGKLIIKDPNDISLQWIVYLGDGKIHFATSTRGKRERIMYLLSQCYSKHNFYIPQDLEDDYQFINHQWQHNHLDLSKVRTILSYMTQEAIVRCLTLSRAKVQFEKIVGLNPLILNLSLKALINPIKDQVRQWVQIRNEISSPFIRLEIKNWQSAKTYFGSNIEKVDQLESLKPYIDDHCTLYEVGNYSGKSVLELGLFFQPLITLNLVNIKPYQEVINSEKKPIIACIDDSQTIQRIVKMTLLTGGFDVISITEPAKAISMFVRQKPDLILMDINMPEIDGYKLAYMMRQSLLLKDIPIVMLTGRDGVMDRVKAKMIGAVGYVCKPFNPQELVQSVHNNLQKNNSGVN
ncbi:response regulator [Geminocystis sp. GBBB08]|uniref:response regulator n=1 Tax=Geminocystis sp. GBBB08 TaxID=2604140 RepID=UPI0027E261DA|nr:response regulator [Geminocystis sp. GBBB08]MBL1210709.1 response regulator [Geminocystis sp. GBBB08]